MRRTLFAAVLLSSLTALQASPADAQEKVLSVGLGAGMPAVDGQTLHGMLTLEAGPRQFPLRFRADLSALDGTVRGRLYQANASVLATFLDRPLTPYLIGGIAFQLNGRFGGATPGGEGFRGGLGLRYRVSNRVLFAENTYHWGINRSLLTFGVQF